MKRSLFSLLFLATILSLILACGSGLWSSPDYWADLIIPSCDSTALVKETRKDRQATDRGLAFFYASGEHSLRHIRDYEGYESSMGGGVVKLNERECKGKDLILRISITEYDLPEEELGSLLDDVYESGLYHLATPSEIPIFVSNRGHKFIVTESGELDCRRLSMEGRGDGCVTDLNLGVQLGRYILSYTVERADPPLCGTGETDWCVGLDAFEMLWKTLDRTMSAYMYYGLTD